jgi:hypothetical protein
MSRGLSLQGHRLTPQKSRLRVLCLLLIALASLGRSLVAANAARLVLGETLPLLEAKALSGQLVTLPRDARGHGAVLVFGFSKAAAKVSRPWMDGCRAAAVAGSVEADVFCYDVRMVEDVPRLFRGAMERGMTSNLPVEFRRQTLLAYQESDAWHERLGATDDKNAYVIACDREGRVRATATGQFIETELKKLLEAIESIPPTTE